MMQNKIRSTFAAQTHSCGRSAVLASMLFLLGSALLPAGDQPRGMVKCANLVYGAGKTSVCYSPEFLKQIQKETNIVAHAEFTPVKLESPELFEHPFAVMTGEGDFELTESQRSAMRRYLTNGGFIVASAGCSSKPWATSFLRELKEIIPNAELKPIHPTHPIFHTVYEIDDLGRKKSSEESNLEGLEVDGKIALIFSRDGLNDTANAGDKCCCCGGNEIKNAQRINVNLLAYALTH
jgi:hypothetical protein